MPASRATSVLKVAVDALVLVNKGLSEKSAVIRASQAEPSLRRVRASALRLIIEVVAQQDFLDKLTRGTLAGIRMSTREQALGRLAALIILDDHYLEELREIGSLRDLAPRKFWRDLDFLIGYLKTADLSWVAGRMAETERLAIQTHHTSWWVEYCVRLFGRGMAAKILSPPLRPRYVRINTGGSRSREQRVRKLQLLAAQLEPVESVPGIYRFSGDPASLSPLFSQGGFQFQDLASYAAVLACEAKPGESVLDLCSAPGTKTCALSQQMKDKGRIVSVDYSVNRMKTWKTETERLGTKIAHPLVEDCTRLGLQGSYDVILLDPPCSGTGILDRNPRMKWHLGPELVERYSKLQHKMLEEAYQFLGPGGRLVYCTCSLTVEENEGIVSSFLGIHPEMELRPVPLDLNLGSPGLGGLSQCRRFYQHRDGTAGYFIARLERSN